MSRQLSGPRVSDPGSVKALLTCKDLLRIYQGSIKDLSRFCSGSPAILSDSVSPTTSCSKNHCRTREQDVLVSGSQERESGIWTHGCQIFFTPHRSGGSISVSVLGCREVDFIGKHGQNPNVLSGDGKRTERFSEKSSTYRDSHKSEVRIPRD